jgi:predicted heme/steroid binding protein
MNPIVRMMKNYIKMPLKYALPLLFIGALVLSSTTGCTTQETTSTVGNATATQVAVPTLKYYTPKDGYKFVAYNASVKNVNLKSQWIGLTYWQLRDTSGGVYSPATASYSSDLPKEFKSIDSQAGDIVNGIIIYEVPTGATLKSLTYDDGTHKTVLNM